MRLIEFITRNFGGQRECGTINLIKGLQSYKRFKRETDHSYISISIGIIFKFGG